jgi:hypothetical protein
MNRVLPSVLLASLALALVALAGCKQGESAPAAAPAATAVTPAATAAAPAPTPAGEPAAAVAPAAAPTPAPTPAPAPAPTAAAGPAHPEPEEGCADAARTVAPEAVPAGQTPLGQPILHAGAAFTEVPEVSVTDLLADPSAYAGKTIQVAGDVSAMCHHGRSWFAVVAGDKSGKQLRVLTTPAFKVPAGSIGRTARAEGVVQLIEVAASHARHLAEGHKLDDPGAATGPVTQVVLRATGADFIDVAAR